MIFVNYLMTLQKHEFESTQPCMQWDTVITKTGVKEAQEQIDFELKEIALIQHIKQSKFGCLAI